MAFVLRVVHKVTVAFAFSPTLILVDCADLPRGAVTPQMQQCSPHLAPYPTEVVVVVEEAGDASVRDSEGSEVTLDIPE